MRIIATAGILVLVYIVSLRGGPDVRAEGLYTLPFDEYEEPTCGFGCYTGHQGTDYVLGELLTGGENVRAAADGLVDQMENQGTAGNVVVMDHGNGHITRYLHLSSFNGSEGFKTRDTIIGFEGNTGGPWCQDPPWCTDISSPYHLHFETKVNGVAVDPYDRTHTGMYLWITRVGALAGSDAKASEGPPGMALTSVANPVTKLSLSGDRIGIIYNGNAWLKEGDLNGLFKPSLFNGATAIAVSGKRIVVIANNGNVYAKEGAWDAGWSTLLGSGIQEIVVEHDPTGLLPSRIGMRAGSYFWVNEGSPASTFYLVANNVKSAVGSIALGAGWIGFVDTQNHAQVKETVTGGWTQVGGNSVSWIALGGIGSNRRIGIVQANVARVREGSIGSSTTSVMSSPAVSRIWVNAGRIAGLSTGGTGYVKQGPINAAWWNVSSGYSDIKLNQ